MNTCSCDCHWDDEYCFLCDHDYADMCKWRWEEGVDYCAICGQDVDLPVHDWDCFK